MKKKNEKWQQLVMLLICIVVMAVAAIERDGKIFGHQMRGQKQETAVKAAPQANMRTLDDGTIVINTTVLGKDITGYAGNVPLEIYLKDGKIMQVKALKNSETPDFFGQASALLTQWNGKTVDEALAMKVDAVSGATFSSRGIIGNMKQGLQFASKNAATPSLLDKIDHSPKSIVGFIVVLLAAIVPLFYHNKKYRLVQLILNVAVLGLWCGTFLSYSLMIGYVSSGINVWVSFIPVIMLMTAFIYPLFGKKSYYCTNICPFGSLQELAGKCNSHKWKLSTATNKKLVAFREILWGILMFLMLIGVGMDWMNYELFSAFIFQSAAVVVMVFAVIVVILSLFVPRPYCRFICPTGSLFKFAQNTK
jgi:uncharacterized protein with FMN-binding domain